MKTITLISTMHSEVGKCTSVELYNIIESIHPQVIFEELSSDNFDKIYNKNYPNESLEVKCIKNYINNYNINQIPVDIPLNPHLSNYEIEYLFDSLKRYEVYKRLEHEQNVLRAKYGFDFLNSKKCSELFDKKKQIEKHLFGFEVDKDNLIRIYTLFHQEQDKRENEILKNIYNYAKVNQFSQAIFLIGAAHKNSLTQKINESVTNEGLKWKFYLTE